MAKIANEMIYKTAEERIKAFDKFCKKCEVCRDCKALRGRNESRIFTSECMAYWLALEADEEKPEPCYECGGEMVGEKGLWKGHDVCYLRCANCGHSTGSHIDFRAAAITHNRVARAVRAAREGEAK